MTEKEKILAEKYINKELSEKEELAFEKVVLQNNELLEYVNVLNIFRSGLKEYAENKADIDFIENLIEETEREKKLYLRLKIIGISFLIIFSFLGIMYFNQFIHKNEENETIPVEPSIEKNESNEKPNKIDEKIADNTLSNQIEPEKLKSKSKQNKEIAYPKELSTLPILGTEESINATDGKPKGINNNTKQDEQVTAWKQAVDNQDFEKAKALMPDNVPVQYQHEELLTYFQTEDREQFYILSEEIRENGKPSLQHKEAMYSLALNPSEIQKIIGLANATL